MLTLKTKKDDSEDSVGFIYFVSNGSDPLSKSEPEDLFNTVNVEDSMSKYDPLDGLFNDTDDEMPPLEPQDPSNNEENDPREHWKEVTKLCTIMRGDLMHKLYSWDTKMCQRG